MNKIEYMFNGDGEFGYDSDPWLGNLEENDYVVIAQNVAKQHAEYHVAYDCFPCKIELIINGNAIGVFEVGLEFEPKCTAKRLINVDENEKIKQSEWVTVVLKKDSKLAHKIVDQFRDECGLPYDQIVIKSMNNGDLAEDKENETI